MTETEQLEPNYEVYLYNDDIHDQVFVVKTLSTICDVPLQISQKIIIEVEKNGKGLVDVCDKEKAVKIRDLLISFGLKSQICLFEL